MNKAEYNLIKYETENAGTLEVTQIRDDVWLTQKQMAQLFNVDRPVITKHTKNIYIDCELNKKKAHVQKWNMWA